MTDFVPSPPEKEQIILLLSDSDLTIKQWKEYSFESSVLQPADRWTFTIGAEELDEDTRGNLKCGAPVKLSINGLIQSTGYIDSIEITSSRSSGTEFRIEGRDRLAQAVDACADPTLAFKEGMTLEDALLTLFKPFGWGTPDKFTIDPSANRDLKTGQSRGEKRSKGKKTFGKELKSIKLHQLHPYPREGVFEFAKRVTQRFGLTIWAGAGGDKLIVGKPDFNQDKAHVLRRNRGKTTNVLEGSIKFDASEQPTIIVADSFSGGGEFGRGRVKSISENSAVLPPKTDTTAKDLYAKYKDAKQLETFHFENRINVARHRVLYLHDDESQTQEQLDNFVKREMALLQRKSLTARYTVEGHGQIAEDGAFSPWVVDTIVGVDDQIAGLQEDMYLLSRTFQKSRNGGTVTSLELVRAHTLEF